ncbi:MAG: HlyD family efflux transporter periplasmic adaptor subunit [Planctomycetota bacterium]
MRRSSTSVIRKTGSVVGTLAERMCRVGDQVSTTEPVFRITDVEDLRTVFFRPQRELALFSGGAEGQELTLSATAEAVPGAAFNGRIERVSPTVDSASGSFRITAHLDRQAVGGEPNQVLAPGMLVRIQIVTDRRPNALVAPKRAVRREGEQAFVQRVVDGVVERVAVVEGYTDADFVELTPSGADVLSQGDRLIVVGGRDLEDGARADDTGLDASATDAVAKD